MEKLWLCECMGDLVCVLLCCDMGQGVCKVQGRCAESVVNNGGSTNVAVCILMVLSQGRRGQEGEQSRGGRGV